MCLNRPQLMTYLLGALLCVTGMAAHADLVLIEEAVEAQQLEVRVDSSGSGYVIGSECVRCDRQTFPVTPATVFKRGGVSVDPSRAFTFSGQPGTIIYNLESRLATKIIQ